MRLGHLAFLLMISLFTINLFSGGCASRQAEGNGKVLAGDIQKLQQIYATSIPAQIRRAFDLTTRHVCSADHEQCSGCAFTISDGGKRVDIFTKKFIAVGLEPGSFGGVEATIVFEGAPNAFWLWLYDVDRDEYDLRSIEELPDSLDEELVHQLRSPAYRRFWM